MSCPHLNGDQCELATLLSGVPCPTTERRCFACLRGGAPTADQPSLVVLGIVQEAKKRAKPKEPERKPARGLGDTIANGLAAVGITKERVSKATQAITGKPCGCGKRQEKLNAMVPYR